MTDKQILKWIDQMQGELDALKKLSGGGGGGGSHVSVELLVGSDPIDYRPDTSTEIDIGVSVSSFDFLLVLGGWNESGNWCISTMLIDCVTLLDCPTAASDIDQQLVFPVNSQANQWIRFSMGANDHTLHLRKYTTCGVYKIYGIKI